VTPPNTTIKMFQISDAHVDRGYLEGSNAECIKPSCCRYETGVGKGENAAGFWGITGRCDIPMRTAERGLERLMEEDPDFIIWTGDNLDHYIWF
jgi:sphingomyelin phosphodiesterase